MNGEADPLEPDPEASGERPVVDARYVAHGRLGAGGMAEVLLAEQRGDAGFARWVVLKRMRPALREEPDFFAMFQDEARVLSSLSHPNLVAALDFVSLDGLPCLVLEYLPGESLAAVLSRLAKRTERIDPKVAVTVACEVLEGLTHAHERTEDGRPLGIVHRDVTPSNVILTYQGEVKLIDFGVVRAEDRLQQRTATGVLKGKRSYAAPEQYKGLRVDARADVYAMGVMLYEMLTGRPLFLRDSAEATMHAVLNAEVEPASAIADDIEPGLDAVLAKAMERDRAKRFSSARAMREALTPYADPSLRIGDWLTELFGAERAEEVLHPERRELRSLDGSDEGPTVVGPSRSKVQSLRAAGRAPPRSESRGRWWIAVAALGLVAGIAAGVFYATNLGDDETYQRALTLAQRSEFEPARELLDAYLAESPDDPDARMLALFVTWWNFAPHIEDAVTAAREAPLSEAQRATLEGLVLVNDGRNAEALALLEPELEEHSSHAPLRYVIGEARWHAGDLGAGARTLERVLDADPRWTMALHHVIEWQLDRRDYDALEALAERVAAVDPTLAAAIEAQVHIGRRDYTAAIDVLRPVTTEHPDDPVLWLHLAAAHRLRGDPNQAGNSLAEAFRAAPRDDRGGGPATYVAEHHLYEGRVADASQTLGEYSALRELTGILWQDEVPSRVSAPRIGRLLPPPLFAATYLETQRLRGESTETTWRPYPQADVAHLGEGLDAELRGDMGAAADAYARGLEAPQPGELRMLLSHHLARARHQLGDDAGAAEACEEVEHPRIYQPYRALLLPDCALWKALGTSDRQLLEEVTRRWSDQIELPSITRGRRWLRGEPIDPPEASAPEVGAADPL